ncbi:MAG: hypothetical protein OXU62_07190 [Gammaproteobacteria bacterium]|nr:hypothetical protein [Gammaproteobacteria bacterium]
MKFETPFGDFLANLSFTEGALLILLISGGFWLYKSQQSRLDERQQELDRLAADNRDYRDRFERLHDRLERRHFDQSDSQGNRP